MLKLFYVTLNDEQQAKAISLELLEKQIAACTNWFPIRSAYRWQGKIECDQEVVLIIKTQANKRKDIETVIKQHIDFTNLIAEIPVESTNSDYLQWLNQEVK